MPNENEVQDNQAVETEAMAEAPQEEAPQDSASEALPENDRIITAKCSCCGKKVALRTPWGGVLERLEPVTTYLRITIRRQCGPTSRFSERLCESCYTAMTDFLAARAATLAQEAAIASEAATSAPEETEAAV